MTERADGTSSRRFATYNRSALPPFFAESTAYCLESQSGGLHIGVVAEITCFIKNQEYGNPTVQVGYAASSAGCFIAPDSWLLGWNSKEWMWQMGNRAVNLVHYLAPHGKGRMNKNADTLLRYSVSLVTQGRHRFFSLTMPSDVLGRTCFVTTRDEDPKAGFQRVLDKSRAMEIAQYVDSGFGSIPSSIVLSAQPEAELEVISGGKTIQFRENPRAFLVLDGQHRVYGFSLANKALRVPVIIYNGLSRQDETRLFIDINTKQRPVPNELLLDIKKLASYENDVETFLGELFDEFADRADSPLLGLMSPSSRSQGKISRVTFNAAMKPLLAVFASRERDAVFEALRAYLAAFIAGSIAAEMDLVITNSTVFRGIMLLFPDVAQRVKDRFGPSYEENNFFEVLEPMFGRLRSNAFKNAGNSIKDFHQALTKALKEDFTL